MSETGEMVFHRDLEVNQWVVPDSGHHMRIPSKKRLEFFFDGGDYEIVPTRDVAVDPLKFRDEKRYIDRLKDARAKTGMNVHGANRGAWNAAAVADHGGYPGFRLHGRISAAWLPVRPY